MNKKLLILFFSVFLALGSSQCFAKTLYLETSDASSLLQQNTDRDFIISPNPSNSKLNLRLPSIDEKTTLTVFDILGKKIYSKEIDQLITIIDVSGWNNGVYLVRVTTDKATQTKRFVKQ